MNGLKSNLFSTDFFNFFISVKLEWVLIIFIFAVQKTGLNE